MKFFREDVFDLSDKDRVIGRILYHKLKSVFRFFWLGLSAIRKSILAKDLAIGDLFVVLTDGIDVSFDGLHE